VLGNCRQDLAKGGRDLEAELCLHLLNLAKPGGTFKDKITVLEVYWFSVK